jgi:hypothetical protein
MVVSDSVRARERTFGFGITNGARLMLDAAGDHQLGLALLCPCGRADRVHA